MLFFTPLSLPGSPDCRPPAKLPLFVCPWARQHRSCTPSLVGLSRGSEAQTSFVRGLVSRGVLCRASVVQMAPNPWFGFPNACRLSTWPLDLRTSRLFPLPVTFDAESAPPSYPSIAAFVYIHVVYIHGLSAKRLRTPIKTHAVLALALIPEFIFVIAIVVENKQNRTKTLFVLRCVVNSI